MFSDKKAQENACEMWNTLNTGWDSDRTLCWCTVLYKYCHISLWDSDFKGNNQYLITMTHQLGLTNFQLYVSWCFRMYLTGILKVNKGFIPQDRTIQLQICCQIVYPKWLLIQNSQIQIVFKMANAYTPHIKASKYDISTHILMPKIFFPVFVSSF